MEVGGLRLLVREGDLAIEDRRLVWPLRYAHRSITDLLPMYRSGRSHTRRTKGELCTHGLSAGTLPRSLAIAHIVEHVAQCRSGGNVDLRLECGFKKHERQTSETIASGEIANV